MSLLRRENSNETTAHLSYQQMIDLVKNSIDGIAVVDRYGTIVFANPAAAGLLGKSEHDIVGYPLGIPATTDGKSYEITITRKTDSATVEMHATTTSWNGESAFVINLRDISENIRILKALRESEEHYRSLFETMTQGVICRDDKGHITAANPAAQRILGLSLSQIMGQTPKGPDWRFIQEDGNDFASETLPSMVALATGETVSGAVMGITSNADHTPRWVRVTAVPQFRPDESTPYCVYAIFEDITSQKKAVDQLQLLAAIIESTNDAVLSKTLSGVITSWNQGAERMYGYTAREAIGENISMLVPPKIEDEIPKLLRQIGEGKKVPPYETSRQTKDGREIHVSLTVSPIINISGKVTGASAIARDITESIKAKQEIERAKIRVENLNSLLYTIREINQLISREKSPAALIQKACDILVAGKDIHSSWIFLSELEDRPPLCVHSGVDDEDISPLIVSLRNGTLPPCCLTAQQQNKAEGLVIMGEKCPVCPFRENRPDGLAFSSLLRHDQKQYGFLTAYVSPSFGEDSEIRHLIEEIAGDISFAIYGIENEEIRKKVEVELIKSEEMLNQTGEMARIGGWEIDLQQNRIVGTPTTKMIMEIPEDNFTTVEQAIEFFDPVLHPRLHEVLRQAIEKGTSFDLELPLTTYNGSRLWSRIVGKSEFHDGKCTRLYGTFQDITELKKALDERLEFEKQFLQTQKLESIGLLAGGVAHDFNNLLSVILGYGGELTATLHKEDPLYEAAEEIVKAGKRSADLTRQLLAFSRKQTLQTEVMNINNSLENIQKMLRRLIGEDIELVICPGKDLRLINADPGQIEQVIMNLAVNSRDAMPQGGKLTIETTNTVLDDYYVQNHVGVTSGEYVLISLSDTGAGMDESTRKRIFEPFFTTKGQGRGTGLGLSTVYGIIKQSGGNIWVYSEPGQGTIFKIYLPAIEAKQISEKVKKKKENYQGRQEKILVIEDEQALRKLCTVMLKKANYRVITATNGGEALQMVEEHDLHPDMILSDVIMPEMSGRVVAERLKKRLPDIKVLFMSGYTDEAIAHHGILDHDVPFLEKPFTEIQLLSKVRDILDG